jgi:GDP-D-mannose dehydratase
MWKILNYDKPDDFVLGTGESNIIKGGLLKRHL